MKISISLLLSLAILDRLNNAQICKGYYCQFKQDVFNSCEHCNSFTDTTVVCGNDGISWLNKYCMKACSFKDSVSIAHIGKCKENDIVVPMKREPRPIFTHEGISNECKECPKYGQDRVCASDGISYDNVQCMLACSYIKERVTVLHKGTCKEFYELFPEVVQIKKVVSQTYSEPQIKDRGDKCKTCNRFGYNVVCGSDHNTWRNEHCMRTCSSHEDVSVVHKGFCAGQGFVTAKD